MAASYPTSIVSLATHNDGDTIFSADINTPNAEVVAVETVLLNGFQHNAKALTDNTYDLGDATHAWRDAYIKRNITNPSWLGVGALLVSNASKQIIEQAALTNGQLLIGSTGAAPAAGAIAAGAGITITLGAGTITIAASTLSARVTADVTKTTNTTLADVTDLTVTVVSGVNYRYKAHLFLAGDTTGGIQVGLAGTATLNNLRLSVIAQNLTTAGNPIIDTMWTSLTSTSATGAGTNQCVLDLEGVIVVTTGGTMKVQFAQSASSGSSTIQRGSYVELVATAN